LGATFAAIGLALAFYLAHALSSLGHPGLDGFADDGVYTAIELAGVGLCALRVRRRAEDRAAWLLITIGLAAWAGGDLQWTVWLNYVANPPYPSVADALYLLMYPTVYAGLVLMMRSRFRHVGAAVWLDGVVVGLAVAAGAAAWVFPTVLGAVSHADSAVVAVNLAYPLADLCLLVFLAVGFALSGWRPGRQWLLLSAGIALTAVADMAYVYEVAKGTYVEGGLTDAIWLASISLLALAAWQPRPARTTRTAVGSQVTILPAVSAFGALALLVVGALLHRVTELSVTLAGAALLTAGVRAGFTYRENVRMLRLRTRDAVTDTLTGLGNRRRLLDDLEAALERAWQGVPATIAFFDLDGFKRYNDSFGHGAGDALLARLGRALAAAIGEHGEAYRLGGDEFCALLDGRVTGEQAVLLQARTALAEHGSGFTVTASCGSVVVPDEADSVSTALNLADERMYAEKSAAERASRAKAQTVLMQQSVLMQILTEREPTLHDHVCDVGVLATAVGRCFELDSEQLDELRRAAELHDLGKLAVPDHILNKPGTLNDSEWRLMRQHTIIGERILNAAPALRPVARLIRSSHERWDGCGYPDGLAGEQIPLGARIIAACDAYDAMTSDRPYDPPRSSAEALAELKRGAGSQFDPRVVVALCNHLAATGEPAAQPSPSGGPIAAAAGPKLST
jgi:diguanylate cyclase (GGDEF)-like protein